MKKLLPQILCCLLLTMPALGNENVARIIKITGDVEVFSDPAQKVAGPPPHALFQGKYYSVNKAKLGQKVQFGNIVQTGNDSKARIIFNNGDQLNVGPGTAYEITWTEKTQAKASGSIINLMRGQIRAVVSKTGPRNNLQVKTRYASMGVRGTDFYVSSQGNAGPTQVSVLRGEVAMKVEAPKLSAASKKVAKLPPVEELKVKSGYLAKVEAPVVVEAPKAQEITTTEVTTKLPVKKIEAPVMKLERLNQQELVTIQQVSTIQVKKEEQQKISQEMAKEVTKLEKKAVESTLEDIKEYDPTLYKTIKEQKVTNVAQVNAQVVQKMYKTAPKAPVKPGVDELKELEEDAYERYYIVE